MGEARGGTMVPGGTSSLEQNIYYSDIKIQNFSAQNPNNSSWFDFYGKIFNINNAIKNILEANYLTETNKNYYLGQMYGMRAWYYFWLYRTYGGVPIKTGTEILDKTPSSGKELFTPRSTPKATLDFIKTDINNSEKYFTDSNRVNNFDRIHWSYAYNKKQNNEIIFAMAFLENEASTPFNSFMYYPPNFINKYDETGKAFPNNDPLKIQSGFLFNEYKFELFQAFDATDTRRATTFLSFYSNAAKTQGRGIALIKYIGFINSANTRVFSDDIPVYRYADVLLMYAEIANKQGSDPSTYINQIRQRAYGSNYTSANAYTHTNFADGEFVIKSL